MIEEHHHGAFGTDRFGVLAERFARFFGTPTFIITQTIIVAFWIAANAFLLTRPFDVYPFILLNLTFSTQAAYAAPLILLAQTRQASRDKALADAQQAHAEEIARQHQQALALNTELTRQIHELTTEVRSLVAGNSQS